MLTGKSIVVERERETRAVNSQNEETKVVKSYNRKRQKMKLE